MPEEVKETSLNDLFSSADMSGSDESDSSTDSDDSAAGKGETESELKSGESSKDDKAASQKEDDAATKEEAKEAKSNAADKAKDDADKSKEKKADGTSKEGEKPKSEDFEKRWKDTHEWGNKEHQDKLLLQSQVEKLTQQTQILEKKLKGEWTDQDEARLNATPDPNQVATTAMQVGKSIASRNAAYEKLGKEETDKHLTRFNELFEKNQRVQQDVLNSDAPVARAIEILAEYDFTQKYGNTPTKIRESLTKEILAQHTKELRKQITEEILSGKKKKDETVEGLSGARGSSGTADIPDKSADEPLTTLFG